jgi:hypothetical protein
MKKIIINNHYYGTIELPDTRNAQQIFSKITRLLAQGEAVSVERLYGKNRMKGFEHYQRGGCYEELLELQLYIDLAQMLKFSSADALALKQKIEFVNDNAHVNLNIAKRLKLANKKQASKARASYLFWDIENFSNVGPMFTHIIEAFEIADEHIYIACNPDSLYLFKAEWEADLYDYGKTLHSFNFTKCDHGKNVADTVLLKNFEELAPKEADVYIVTYDRELKELFLAACDESNNLYILSN